MPFLTTEVYDLVADIPVDELAQAMLAGALNCMRVPPKNKEQPEKGRARAAKEGIGADIEHAARAHHLNRWTTSRSAAPSGSSRPSRSAWHTSASFSVNS